MKIHKNTSISFDDVDDVKGESNEIENESD